MRHVLSAISLALLIAGSSAAAAPERVNCVAPHHKTLDLDPVGAGPLTLAAVYCQMVRVRPFVMTAPVVSPDARAIAYYGENGAVRIARLGDADAWADFAADLGVFLHFSSEIRSIPAFAWDSQSRSVWTATHDRVRPSGWTLSSLRPLRTGESGKLDMMPPLEHAAGPLDGLLWAGGDGLAIAHFGTRGGFYRPEHDDPAPTFAIVDAAHGRVLDSLPFDAIETLRARKNSPPYVLVNDAAAAVLPDGRVRALLRVGQWVVWTQGDAPRTLPDPYAGESHGRMVLAPDGERVLVGRLLRTAGGVCIEPRGCFPGQPVEGVLAALHDVATGRELWTIRAAVNRDLEFPTPAISPDGRYALVGLVPDKRPLIALVAMDSGEIVQRLPGPGGDHAFGFANGGRTIWTHAYGLTALYDVKTPAR
jgi:hypothetical protein